MKTKRRTYEPQPRLGLEVGDLVKVNGKLQDAKGPLLLPEDANFYEDNVGEILSFLSGKSYTNNGAALVRIKQKYGMEICVYLDTDVLIKQ